MIQMSRFYALATCPVFGNHFNKASIGSLGGFENIEMKAKHDDHEGEPFGSPFLLVNGAKPQKYVLPVCLKLP